MIFIVLWQCYYTKTDMCCHQQQKIVLVLSIHATRFGHNDHPEALNTCFKTQNKIHIYFKSVRSHEFN